MMDDSMMTILTFIMVGLALILQNIYKREGDVFKGMLISSLAVLACLMCLYRILF